MQRPGTHQVSPVAAVRLVRFLFTDDAQKHAPVVRPSITWGVIGDKDAQKEGRGKVLDFLKSEGINTDELDSVELPTSVDVMAERLEFIKNLGLEKKQPAHGLLQREEEHGPGCQLPGSSWNVRCRSYQAPQKVSYGVTIDIQPVVIYLMGLGISRMRVPVVLVKYPEMLGYRLEGTPSTSVAYLVSIGVHIKAIAGIVVQHPEILGMRVGNNIKPKVDYLCSLGMPREAVGKILEFNMQVLKCDPDSIKARVNCLLEAGVSHDGLPGLILQYPSVLFTHIDKKVQRQADWLKQELKMSKEDFARALEGMPKLLTLNHKYGMSRVRFYTSRGFTLAELGKMAASCPQILVADLRDLKDTIDYFEKHMKRELKELKEFPAYFTYGLEERIRFRYKRVAERNLKFSLAWFLNCSNAVFQQRISGPIYEDPAKPEKEFVFGGAIEQLRQPEEVPTPELEADVEDEQQAVGFP